MHPLCEQSLKEPQKVQLVSIMKEAIGLSSTTCSR